MRVLLAGLVDQSKLLVDILEDLVELGAVLDELEYLLVDLADIGRAADRFHHPYVPLQLLGELLHLGYLLLPILHLEVELEHELLEDLLIHAPLEHL